MDEFKLNVEFHNKSNQVVSNLLRTAGNYLYTDINSCLIKPDYRFYHRPDKITAAVSEKSYGTTAVI